jgi:FkbM family methyltransferase
MDRMKAARRGSAGVMRGMTPAQFARRAPGALLRRTLWRARASLPGRVIRTSLALVPQQRLAYSWCEVKGGRTARTWLLSDTRRSITVRCGTRDRDILREVFVDQEYALPPEVDEVLNSRKAPSVVDLGANIGLYGLWVLSQWPEARIHSFEPDPDNLAILDRNVSDAGVGSRWTVTRACAARAAGTVQFLGGQQADSRTASDADPMSDLSTVPAVDVFPHLHDADLLKIDIEGGEWPLLTDARFRDLKVPAIVLEYHAYNSPVPADSGETARRLLERCGYAVAVTHRAAPGLGTLWAWRTPASALSE